MAFPTIFTQLVMQTSKRQISEEKQKDFTAKNLYRFFILFMFNKHLYND